MSSEKINDLGFEQIKKGDISAYRRLFDQSYVHMVNFAYKIIRNETAAEEIVQEVFIYLWEKRAQINIKSSLSSYLFSAIKNKCINYLKIEIPRDQAKVDIEETNITVEIKEESEYGEEQLNKIVEDAVNSLPPKCRNIFLLSRSGGLTYDEIAEELDISKKTVENQMTIALKKLRETLNPILKRR